MTNFPYNMPRSNKHELNLDWILDEMQKLRGDWNSLGLEWIDVQQAYANLQAFFNNLNVQTEINNKISDMYTSGELAQVLGSALDKPNLANQNVRNILRKAATGAYSDPVTYIMVGDSTRASNGAYTFEMVSRALTAINVVPILSAQSGLEAEHWGSTGDTIQPGYIQASDLPALIPGNGYSTIVDICLGINDDRTSAEIMSYIQSGINIIRAVKPNTTFVCTSPNFVYRTSDHNETLHEVYEGLWAAGYGKIDVNKYVFKTQADMTGFYLDDTHPNEQGQRKIADYIIEQLVPSDLTTGNYGINRILLGHLTTAATNNPIRASGIRCEVKYTAGTPTGNLYLKKINGDANHSLAIYDLTSGNSLTGFIPLAQGEHTLLNGYKPGVTTTSLVSIDDPDPLLDLTDYVTFFPMENGVVSAFSAPMTLMAHLKRLYDMAH